MPPTPAPARDLPAGGGSTAAPPISRLTTRALILLTAGPALAARLAYWLLATPDRPLTSDAAQYHFLARNLAEGDGYVDRFPQLELHATAFRPPGYPALLSLVYRVLWPTPGIGRAVNVVIGVAVVIAVVVLVRRHLGPRPALVAGLGVALWPNIVANDTYVLTEPLSLLLLVGLLWFLLDDRWVPAAALTGVLVLTRPSAQFLVLLLALYLWRHVGWRRALGYAAITALVVAPWVIRNWVQLDSPVLVTSNGFNYAALYSPPADELGAFVDPTRHPYFDARRLDQFDEVVWDRSLRRVAIDHIRERPRVVPEVVSRNTTAMFEIRPTLNRKPEFLDGRNRDIRAVTYWLIWPLLGLGLWGLVRRNRSPLVVLAAATGAYFTVASLVFVAPPRLRAPLDLMLIIAAASLLADRSLPPEPEDDPAAA